MRTRNQIKFDRTLSVWMGSLGIFGFGYYLAMSNLIHMLISFVVMLFLIRVDRCNNDLEYGRYKEADKGVKE